ncbi:D-galactose-binding periplasmic protein precursor [Clostridium sp. DL-VIII]|uniref:galactose ABC transporter substrate-binding protein n=1 Tax=Clostridium sp. DL-VIII TaxID=641107 RepID=UPI00023AFF8F|nr:galactose ABC transporter substrate-binding protein [Clostridium sp. DL-VIII]EHI99108.1 D-galactose-binding periplasmic protein precursor [Clostridium sp. DL-VIII]
MKILKRILNLTLLTIILIIELENKFYIVAGASTGYRQELPIRIGLFTRDLNDDYIILLRKNFEDIQKNNLGKVVFTFYNANFNQSTQNSDIENELKKGIDLILLDMVNLIEIEGMINTISQHNVPVVVFNREPFTMAPIKSYKKAFYVGTDSKQGGTIQGRMIADAWKNHKQLIDKNQDNVLQYILLIGEKLNQTAINRSAYSISTIQKANIKIEELASPILHWDTKSAEDTVSALFLRYGNKIEAIISNDDSMAIGAIQALQKYGYNLGDKEKTIVVVGLDGVSEAKDLISKGFMLGTASQDTADMTNTIYAVGMNLVYDRNPVEGVPYKLDETGVAIFLPYEEYTGPMFQQKIS